jgi:hypothetical protein
MIKLAHRLHQGAGSSWHIACLIKLTALKSAKN